MPATRRNRWYFGGVASTIAVMVTHPLDLLKVMLQTQQDKGSIFKLSKNVYQEHGFLAFYNGLSASMLRQMTYTTTRFGLYEIGKLHMNTDSFLSKVGLAASAGVSGGLIGNPFDVVNVRMQNDAKLPLELRRNYKHAIDGLWQVYSKEGTRALFAGFTFATSRSILLTIGQIAIYDQVKTVLTDTLKLRDDIGTHLLCSIITGITATTLTQPLDVLKTRAMNAKPNQYRNIFHIITHTAKTGPMGFFKGYVPSFMRQGPNTIILFVLMEQLRLHFGVLVDEKPVATTNKELDR